MAENLVVVSKVKKMIKDKSGLNTSSNVMDKLSEIVKKVCGQAIEDAQKDGRKTVIDRDFQLN